MVAITSLSFPVAWHYGIETSLDRHSKGRRTPWSHRPTTGRHIYKTTLLQFNYKAFKRIYLQPILIFQIKVSTGMHSNFTETQCKCYHHDFTFSISAGWWWTLLSHPAWFKQLTKLLLDAATIYVTPIRGTCSIMER